MSFPRRNHISLGEFRVFIEAGIRADEASDHVDPDERALTEGEKRSLRSLGVGYYTNTFESCPLTKIAATRSRRRSWAFITAFDDACFDAGLAAEFQVTP